MPNAVIIVYHNGGDLGAIITALSNRKHVTKQDQICGDNIAITHDLTKSRSILHFLSTLRLNKYDIAGIIVQKSNATSNDVNDYNNIISQFVCFGVPYHIIDASTTANPSAVMNDISLLLSKIGHVQQDKQFGLPIQQDIMIRNAPNGLSRDINDIDNHKHGRMKHDGTIVGKYIQTPPLIFTRDGHSVWLGDMFRGRSAFLILGGPSFANIDKTKLSMPGVLTMGVNNSVKSFRPNLWVSVDHPGNFIKSCWLDPKIMKFVPYAHTNKKIFDNEKWQESNISVGDCPNVWFYRRNEHFVAEQFLWEDTFNWGNHKNYGGGRSVMLVAIRLLFYLGVRRVYLLGCDFKMSENYKYHFAQDRTKSSINGNNSAYKMLINRFKQLQPIFLQNDYYIFNCNPDSELKVFPYISFDEAIRLATSEMPRDIANERTEGLYERIANLKKEQKDNNK
ncbi:MAG: hypothetical protein QXP41_00475 [Candidatus Nitrosocaldus sp.]